MKSRTAQSIFVVFNLLAIPAVVYPIYTWYRVNTDIAQGVQEIEFDSGDFYLLLMSVFWAMAGVQYAGHRGHAALVRKWGSVLLVVWLAACLLSANVFPRLLIGSLAQAGYTMCRTNSTPSRIARGENLVYRQNCAE